MTLERARDLRANLTNAERRLWRLLRRRAIDGHKFRRQRPVGPYIVDFICLERGLVIEVDGGQHDDQSKQDAVRTQFLEREGFQVLRFWNNEVLANTDGVVELIRSALLKDPHPTLPHNVGEGEQEQQLRIESPPPRRGGG